MRIRELVTACRERGDLCTVSDAIDRESMPGRIQDEEKNGNRAILFERVNGYDVPVLANLYGSMERYALGPGSGRLEDVGAHRPRGGPSRAGGGDP